MQIRRHPRYNKLLKQSYKIISISKIAMLQKKRWVSTHYIKIENFIKIVTKAI
jgi:hypothetical protein